jgi:hypothetical protein
MKHTNTLCGQNGELKQAVKNKNILAVKVNNKLEKPVEWRIT